MFSILNQGSIIYILDKTDKPKLKIGEIISISQPKIDYKSTGQFGQFQPTTVDIKVNVEGTTYEYNSIPSNYSIISYNNGKITLSETKQGLQSEVESILQNSKQIVDKIDTYKQNIIDCEYILKELNPQFAKDKERDDRLDSLETRFEGVASKLDKILDLVTNKA